MVQDLTNDVELYIEQNYPQLSSSFKDETKTRGDMELKYFGQWVSDFDSCQWGYRWRNV